ncbi:hypothetical protein DXV75_12885 [Alteromonas aestuariivivens]|uniref:DUF4136 domain-containing protein n=1 Tax=Alteromonas aestuariivivens TaxID=1938339 RepID=A0A3D8M4H2_9ALTE|nr:hypothetical protein [Alteromonas aestuariivivens]RDV24589.1 hypothetical protein DXV75_12885 [Alteromonas aestuariivivens]
MKLSQHPGLFITGLVAALTFGCASAPEPPQMEYQQRFAHRINDQGETEFAFGFGWVSLPPTPDTMREPRVRERGNRGSQRSPVQEGYRPNPGYGISNEQKLALEDKAVEALNARLAEEALCDSGHKLDSVIWDSNRIRLTGHCL